MKTVDTKTVSPVSTLLAGPEGTHTHTTTTIDCRDGLELYTCSKRGAVFIESVGSHILPVV